MRAHAQQAPSFWQGASEVAAREWIAEEQMTATNADEPLLLDARKGLTAPRAIIRDAACQQRLMFYERTIKLDVGTRRARGTALALPAQDRTPQDRPPTRCR